MSERKFVVSIPEELCEYLSRELSDEQIEQMVVTGFNVYARAFVFHYVQSSQTIGKQHEPSEPS